MRDKKEDVGTVPTLANPTATSLGMLLGYGNVLTQRWARSHPTPFFFQMRNRAKPPRVEMNDRSGGLENFRSLITWATQRRVCVNDGGGGRRETRK